MRNPLTLEAFADWLEKKPAAMFYEFHCKRCAIGSYLTEHGFPMKTLGTEMWVDKDGNKHPLPIGWNRIAMTSPHTYGDAAQRARAALAG